MCERASSGRGEGMADMGDTGSDSVASVFEAIRHLDSDGGEYWSARELAKALTYVRWEQFPSVIAKAREACEASGNAVSDHFRDAPKMVPLGSGAHRRIDDWHLSRYACYLIVQNGDPSKPVVALGQTYFAVQTRRMELADAAVGDTLAGLDETQRRLVAREQLARQNATLAIFQDHGYRGLYNGERARDIAARKGLARGQHILDHMGSEELAANLFRATQAEAKITREGVTAKEAANRAHHDVGAAVRSFIIDTLGGTPPEQLPTPAESIAQAQARERRALEQERVGERQPSLFEPTLSEMDEPREP